MELKEPEWVKMNGYECLLRECMIGHAFKTDLPRDGTAIVISSGLEICVVVSLYQKLAITSRRGRGDLKMDHPVSAYVFNAIERYIKENESEKLEQRQKQLEVLRLFEVQHDAGRQLPTTSSPE